MRTAVLVLLGACSGSSAIESPDAAAPVAPDDAAPPVAPSALEIRSLGVQGFVLHHGHDTVMTAPLFTRQSAIEVTFNVPLPSDTAAVDAGLAGVPLDELRAVISGHAHYDHFLDVPHILDKAPGAIAYTNLTGRHILAALAPD